MHSSACARMPLLHAGRSIAADSCSLIFLNRLHLLERYGRVHRLVLTQALYDEITRMPGAKPSPEDISLYTRMFAGNIPPVPSEHAPGSGPEAGLSVADRTLIRAFYTLNLDGILTDDKKVCSCCRRRAIPYINTPMALFALLYNGGLSHARYTTALQELYAMGRYAPFVRTHMENLYRSYCAHTPAAHMRQNGC